MVCFFGGKSLICSVRINKHPDAAQSYDTIAGGENSFVLAAVTEVASCDDTPDDMFGGQFPLTLIFVHGNWVLL